MEITAHTRLNNLWGMKLQKKEKDEKLTGKLIRKNTYKKCQINLDFKSFTFKSKESILQEKN